MTYFLKYVIIKIEKQMGKTMPKLTLEDQARARYNYEILVHGGPRRTGRGAGINPNLPPIEVESSGVCLGTYIHLMNRPLEELSDEELVKLYEEGRIDIGTLERFRTHKEVGEN